MDNIRKFTKGIQVDPVTSTSVDTKGEIEVLNSNGKLNYHNGTSASPMVTEAHTATLTNKTIDGDDNTVQDLALTSLKTNLTDASKFLVRDASGIVVSNTKDVPVGVVVGDSDTQTLTNKTLTSPTINSGDINGVTLSLNDSDSAFNLEVQSTSTLTSDKTLTFDVNDGNRTVTVAGDATINGSNSGDVTVSDTATIDLTLTGQALSADIVAGSIGNTQLGTGIDVSQFADGSVSDTEFQYLNGVTSAIQTQLNDKVTGPATATDEAIVRYDGTTGELIQDSLVTISDAGVVSGATQLNVDNIRVDGNTISSTDTNGNITLDPNGTGTIEASAPVNVVGSLRSDTSLVLEETGAGTDTITIQAPASIASSYTLTLPVDGGTTGQFLSTNGSGVTSWATAAVGTTVRTETGNYNIADSDSIIRADSSGGNITLNLPTASSSNQDKIFRIIKVSSDFNTVTVGTGFSTTLGTEGETCDFINNGTTWYLIERNIPGNIVSTAVQVITGSGSNPTKGTLALDSAVRWRVGRFLYTQYSYNQTAASGNAGSGDYRFNVPSGLTVDTTYVATNFPTTAYGSGVIGQGTYQENAATGYFSVVCDTSGNIIFRNILTGNNVGSGFCQFTLATINLSAVWAVPITGWRDGLT
jgi:hypothetical protein